jgi:hypothetical protein
MPRALRLREVENAREGLARARQADSIRRNADACGLQHMTSAHVVGRVAPVEFLSQLLEDRQNWRSVCKVLGFARVIEHAKHPWQREAAAMEFRQEAIDLAAVVVWITAPERSRR